MKTIAIAFGILCSILTTANAAQLPFSEDEQISLFCNYPYCMVTNDDQNYFVLKMDYDKPFGHGTFTMNYVLNKEGEKKTAQLEKDKFIVEDGYVLPNYEGLRERCFVAESTQDFMTFTACKN